MAIEYYDPARTVRKGLLTLILDGLAKYNQYPCFCKSNLVSKWFYGTLFLDRSQTINGISVRLLILGESSYPLLPWLMKPYSLAVEGLKFVKPGKKWYQANFGIIRSGI